MNKFKIVILFSGLSLLASCYDVEENKTCKWDHIELIQSSAMFHGQDTEYIHYVLLDKFPKRCLDSISIAKVVDIYIRSTYEITELKNLKYIEFHNSSKYFDFESFGPDMDKANHSFLFDVMLNKDSKKVLDVKYNPWRGFGKKLSE